MQPGVTKELLFAAVLEECGHRLELWSETLGDGTVVLHGHAPCDVCCAVVTNAVRRVYPHMKITIVD